jgi:hypothetical protein
MRDSATVLTFWAYSPQSQHSATENPDLTGAERRLTQLVVRSAERNALAETDVRTDQLHMQPSC